MFIAIWNEADYGVLGTCLTREGAVVAAYVTYQDRLQGDRTLDNFTDGCQTLEVGPPEGHGYVLGVDSDLHICEGAEQNDEGWWWICNDPNHETFGPFPSSQEAISAHD